MKKYDSLPEIFKTQAVKPYYQIIKKRAVARFFKRLFDMTGAIILVVLLSPIMFLIAVVIRCDSCGPAFFKGRRITTYGRPFTIYKFRTMKVGERGGALTVSEDKRITRLGKILRPLRLDELPQLFNVLKGEMSFVGPRPEDEKFVKAYSGDMIATLLMPAGITSLASIRFKNEDKILKTYISKGFSENEAYIKFILPEKTNLNLSYLKNFGFFYDLKICVKTLFSK